MAKISNLVTFAIFLGLITLLIYLYYLRKRRTEQALLWLRAQNIHAQSQFGMGHSTVIYPYEHHRAQDPSYYCNNGLIFSPMAFNEAAQRNHNFPGMPWQMNPTVGFPGDMSHSNSFNAPAHFIASPPYTPGNFVSPSTLEDLPPPYSSVVVSDQSKIETATQSEDKPEDKPEDKISDEPSPHITTPTTNK